VPRRLASSDGRAGGDNNGNVTDVYQIQVCNNNNNNRSTKLTVDGGCYGLGRGSLWCPELLQASRLF
jgi:hypothetical protein